MRQLRCLCVLIVLALASLIPNAWADVVLDWNQIASDILVNNESYQNPGYASRSMAMTNLAIHDSFALTSKSFRDKSFFKHRINSSLTWRASGKVAAAQAAYTVLSSLYPDQQSFLDLSLDSSLDEFKNNRAKKKGIKLGKKIGKSILAQRANDGYDTNVQYQPTYEIGHWQPDPINPGQEAWGPAWGEVDTFALRSVDNYLPGPTPDMDSQEYADSYNEVKMLGSVDSTYRTPEQTEIGLFWAYDRVGMGTPHNIYNNILRTIAEQEGNSTRQNAKLFAKATVAMADAGIVAWNSKFEEDFWRPVTGIRDGDYDGNPWTDGDADWTPLGAPDGEDHIGFTPPFPTYISGHATFGGALFGSLMEFYKTDNIQFSMSSKELEVLLDDPTLQSDYGLSLQDSVRSFSSLSEAMAENGRSRVYLGIHWDYDDLVGQEVGQDIAESIFDQKFVSADQSKRKRKWNYSPRFDQIFGSEWGYFSGYSPYRATARVPEPTALVLLTMGLIFCNSTKHKVAR